MLDAGRYVAHESSDKFSSLDTVLYNVKYTHTGREFVEKTHVEMTVFYPKHQLL